MNNKLFISIFLLILLLTGCSSNTQLPINEVHTKIETNFQNNDTIAEYKIDKLEFSHKNNEGEDVYSLKYSMKPANPETYILAGNGIQGEDGWIIDREYFVTITKEGELVFATGP